MFDWLFGLLAAMANEAPDPVNLAAALGIAITLVMIVFALRTNQQRALLVAAGGGCSMIFTVMAMSSSASRVFVYGFLITATGGLFIGAYAVHRYQRRIADAALSVADSVESIAARHPWPLPVVAPVSHGFLVLSCLCGAVLDSNSGTDYWVFMMATSELAAAVTVAVGIYLMIGTGIRRSKAKQEYYLAAYRATARPQGDSHTGGDDEADEVWTV